MIELIYKKKLKGTGAKAIARELNELDIWKPPKSKRNKTGGWRGSYISKILRSRSVIGEFQPHKLVQNSKTGQYERSPEGAPIPDYFPPAIDEDLFYAVQNQIRLNRDLNGYAGGRTGKCNNLFTHVVKCGLCKGPMHFIDKGRPPKGNQYLHCDSAKRKLGCIAKPVRYDEFEKLFFNNFEEVTPEELLPGTDENQFLISEIERKIITHRQKLSELEDQKNNLIESIATTGDKKVRELLEMRLSRAIIDLELLTYEKQKLEREKKRVRESQKNCNS